MVNASKPVIFVVISLLVVMLIYSSASRVYALQESPRDICKAPLERPGNCYCWNTPEHDGLQVHCETCDVNTVTGDFENCTSVKKHTAGLTNVPGSGVLEQPPTPKKHGGTVLPKSGGVLKQPDQGTTQTDNNKHSVKRSGGSGVLEQPQTGESTAKKGSNNDNSPTPPACPDKGPIPPNCTVKPKF